jgi:hypothetical protein
LNKLIESDACNRHPVGEVTAVQKLHQGTSTKTGSNRFRVPFFVSFLGKQKRNTSFKCSTFKMNKHHSVTLARVIADLSRIKNDDNYFFLKFKEIFILLISKILV